VLPLEHPHGAVIHKFLNPQRLQVP
jgi:hypothetical protein